VKALVVGYGSIGQRHARILKELGCETAVVSRSNPKEEPCFRTVETGLAEWRPEYIVIANKTSEHHGAVQDLAAGGYTGRLLVEKPVFEKARDFPRGAFSHAAVAYNLRFHPVVAALRSALENHAINEAHLHVGQWLPDWRPAVDYRHSSSAKKADGGGVLRDLSHEIDLALLLFGPGSSLTATGGQSGKLEIETEDHYDIRLQTDRGAAVRVSLNYLDQPARRTLDVKSEAGNFQADLIKGTLTKDGHLLVQTRVERDDTYRSQHLAMIKGDTETLCTIEDGLAVVRLIEAAERSNAAGGARQSLHA
jgi:predicted dehydrogenase